MQISTPASLLSLLARGDRSLGSVVLYTRRVSFVRSERTRAPHEDVFSRRCRERLTRKRDHWRLPDLRLCSRREGTRRGKLCAPRSLLYRRERANSSFVPREKARRKKRGGDERGRAGRLFPPVSSASSFSRMRSRGRGFFLREGRTRRRTSFRRASGELSRSGFQGEHPVIVGVPNTTGDE